MTFSIIVPVYNVESYLDRCVKSLIAQTYSDIEIILVDDGSQDKCPEICDRYAAQDLRIKTVHKKNRGLSSARNYGIKVASGEYLIFVDSDDYIENDTCERLLPFVQQKIDVIIGDAFIEGGTMDLSHIITKEILKGDDYLLRAYRAGKAPMAAWLNIFSREFLISNDLKFKNGILHEDEEFTPRAMLKAKSVACSGIAFYHYILRDNSITTKKDKRKNAKDLFDTCIELESIYKRIENKELRMYLLDSLAFKYLSLSQSGKIYQYGKKYIHKRFVIKNAFTKRTRIKAIIYCVSPRFYYVINYFVKRYF